MESISCHPKFRVVRTLFGPSYLGTHPLIESLSQRLKKKTEIRLGDTATEVWVGRGSDKPVAQGQYVVSDTRCPALHDCEFE